MEGGVIRKSLLDLIHKNIENGYIRVARHPKLPLSIFNYTQKAQFENYWDLATRICRGLVLDDQNRVVIKCPEKFFNHDDILAPKINLAKARISEKLDGYYISIKIDDEYGLIITSRGSFDNKYVSAAKALLSDEQIYKMSYNYTYFCELLQDFPGDESIIVTKHPIPELVCWAIKDSNHNEIIPDESCPFRFAKTFSLTEANEYLKSEVEGVVAQDLNTFERVKIKTDWFFEHHRMLSNCTKKTVWELLSSGRRVEDLEMPDEFITQMKDWQHELSFSYDLIEHTVVSELAKRCEMTDKEIALDNTLSKEMKSFIFTLKKKGLETLEKQIWQTLRQNLNLL